MGRSLDLGLTLKLKPFHWLFRANTYQRAGDAPSHLTTNTVHTAIGCDALVVEKSPHIHLFHQR